MTMRIALASWVAIAILVSSPSLVLGQSVHRDYDVRELIGNIPDLTDVPNVNAPATNPAMLPADEKRADAPGREQLVSELTSWLRDSARHDEPKIDITEKAGWLAIDATQAQQERITRLIEQRAAERKTQASIEVRYLYLPREAEDALDEPLRDLVTLSRGPGSHNRPGIELSDDQVSALLETSQSHENSMQMTAPRVTLSNGQRAYVRIATDEAYVADYTKHVDAAGAISWTPRNENVRTGVLLDVRCRVNVATQTVACDVNATVDRLLDLKSESFTAAGAKADLKIQEPEVDHAELHMLVAARDGGTKMYFVARKSDDTRLYVLVKPTIVQAP